MKLNRNAEWELSLFPPEGVTQEEYDRWYIYQVEAGIDDVARGAVVSHEEVMRQGKLTLAKARINRAARANKWLKAVAGETP